jgi:nucleotide-binding universal stress UspA family protein
MSTGTTPLPDLQLVVGYDGSAPADRALDAAVSLLQGRTGRITVVYVAHIPSAAMLSPTAEAQVVADFDQVEQELRARADARLRDTQEGWGFVRREGIVTDELLAVTKETQGAHPRDTVVALVGSSSHAMHRVVGSVAVSLARHSPVPVVIVP